MSENNIREILMEISSEPGNNKKMDILSSHKDNEVLKRFLYLSNSKRVKFFIKQIPPYTTGEISLSLSQAFLELEPLMSRTLTGDAAREHLAKTLSLLSADDAYVIERVIDKDPKIGMGTTFINKVYKENKKDADFIEDEPYMGAISFNEDKARAVFNGCKSALSQIKMDGRYCNAIIRGGEVELSSRSGEATIVTDAPFLLELSRFPDCVLNGELTMKSTPRYESNGIIASIIDICSKKGIRSEAENKKKMGAFEKEHGSFNEALSKIQYTVWDTITIDEYFDKRSETPYYTRLANVESMIEAAGSSMVCLIESKLVGSYAEAMNHFQEVLATEVDGVPQEGTILKAYDGIWRDGKPSHQIKLKLEMNVDLEIVGFNYGTPGTKNELVISSLNAQSSDGKLVTSPQGLTEELMKFITENKEALLGRIIECKCNGISRDKTGGYSLFYPAFKGLRDDKNTADSLEDIIANENMVKSVGA
jgi:DNA ligase-1